MRWIIGFLIILWAIDKVLGNGSDDFLREEVRDNEKK